MLRRDGRRSCRRLPDAMPQDFDTASEVLARAVAHHALGPDSATQLVDLFDEARFSPHVMTEAPPRRGGAGAAPGPGGTADSQRRRSREQHDEVRRRGHLPARRRRGAGTAAAGSATGAVDGRRGDGARPADRALAAGARREDRGRRVGRPRSRRRPAALAGQDRNPGAASESSRSDWDKHLRPMLARQFELASGHERPRIRAHFTPPP